MRRAAVWHLVALAALALAGCDPDDSTPEHYYTTPAWAVHLSIFGGVILLAELWALAQLWRGPDPMKAKLLWTVVVLALPFVGLALFLVRDKPGEAGPS